MRAFVSTIFAVLLITATEARSAGLRSMQHAFEESSALTPEMTRLMAEPRLPEWRETIAQFSHFDKERQLAEAQAYVNRARPRAQITLAPASPSTMMLQGGDCKGYAVAKMAMLRDLGWPLDDMRLLVVWLPFHVETHLILLVRWQGHIRVLDNLADTVTVDHYAFGDFTAVVGQYRWPDRAAAQPVALR